MSDRGERAVTVHAVAAAAGVSTATVSRALNGQSVTPENLVRVLEAVATLGYVPNEAAHAIRGGRTMTIGIVMNVDIHPNLELMSVVNRMIGDMEQQGYSTFLSVVRADADVETYLRRFAERRVDGLFYWNAAKVPSLDALVRAGTPIIAIGYQDDGCDLPLVTVDAAPVYRTIYGRLKALGHRHVCEIGFNQAAAIHQQVAEDVGLRWEQEGIGRDAASIREFVESLVSPDAPTAVFASFPMAVQILNACAEAGLSVPGHVSVIGSTDSDFATALRTPLSAMRTDYEAIGAASAAAMRAGLAGEAIEDVAVPNAISWIERASTGPAPTVPLSGEHRLPGWL